MNRLYGRDIESAIITQLKDAASGINAILQLIDTERAETLCSKAAIKDKNIQAADFNNESPSIEVFVQNQTPDISGSSISLLPEQITTTYTATVIIGIKETNRIKMNKMLNNYEEAITRTLHGAKISGFTWIVLNKITKGTAQSVDNNIWDILEAEFSIRIN